MLTRLTLPPLPQHMWNVPAAHLVAALHLVLPTDQRQGWPQPPTHAVQQPVRLWAGLQCCCNGLLQVTCGFNDGGCEGPREHHVTCLDKDKWKQEAGKQKGFTFLQAPLTSWHSPQAVIAYGKILGHKIRTGPQQHVTNQPPPCSTSSTNATSIESQTGKHNPIAATAVTGPAGLSPQ